MISFCSGGEIWLLRGMLLQGGKVSEETYF